MKTYGEFFKGENTSRAEQSGFTATSNLDIHSEIGFASPQLALTSESTTPNEACISAIVPNGDVYFFSTTSGKTWKRAASDSTYSLVNTNANGQGHKGTRYFNGYLYYWTSAKLGRFDLSSTWTDSWQTLSNSNARGSAILNLSLFIADGNDISSVDNAGTFAQSSLDLESNFIITDICAVGNDLLIGTVNTTSNGTCKAFLWDTYSPSWSYEDEVFEAGINCFIQLDNLTLAQAGNAGWLYYWTGSRLEKFRKIKGITTTNTATSHALTTTLNGKALFANTTKIYSIHRESKDLPLAICQEYTSTGTINSIIAAGSQLLVSYTNGETIGVDKIGTNYATATLDTPEANESVQMVEVYYDSIGTGASIGISTNINGAGWVAQTPITDSVTNRVYFDGSLGDVNFAQARITLTPATTNKPVIRNIVLR